jgi:hypothetical protein
MTPANETETWRRVLTQHLRHVGCPGDGDHLPLAGAGDAVRRLTYASASSTWVVREHMSIPGRDGLTSVCCRRRGG